jgi:5-methylcytosine-specific restriction protein A
MQRWTTTEERAVARLYMEMLAAGDTLNKASKIRAARAGLLKDRSSGSIEYKLMNVTTWCLALGLPVVVGYKPYGNAAGSLGEHVRKAFSDRRSSQYEPRADGSTVQRDAAGSLSDIEPRASYDSFLD